MSVYATSRSAGSVYGGSLGGGGSVYGRSSSRTRPSLSLSPTDLSPQDLIALQAMLAATSLAKPKAKKKDAWGLLGLVPNKVEQTIKEIAEGLIYTPVGLVNTGIAAAYDIKGLAEGKDPSHLVGDIFVPTVKQVATDLRHPLRHPGYTIMDAWALGSMGAGGVGRLSRATRAMRTGGSLPPQGYADAITPPPRPQGGPSLATSGPLVPNETPNRIAPPNAFDTPVQQLTMKRAERPLVGREQRDALRNASSEALPIPEERPRPKVMAPRREPPTMLGQVPRVDLPDHLIPKDEAGNPLPLSRRERYQLAKENEAAIQRSNMMGEAGKAMGRDVVEGRATMEQNLAKLEEMQQRGLLTKDEADGILRRAQEEVQMAENSALLPQAVPGTDLFTDRRFGAEKRLDADLEMAGAKLEGEDFPILPEIARAQEALDAMVQGGVFRKVGDPNDAVLGFWSQYLKEGGTSPEQLQALLDSLNQVGGKRPKPEKRDPQLTPGEPIGMSEKQQMDYMSRVGARTYVKPKMGRDGFTFEHPRRQFAAPGHNEALRELQGDVLFKGQKTGISYKAVGRDKNGEILYQILDNGEPLELMTQYPGPGAPSLLPSPQIKGLANAKREAFVAAQEKVSRIPYEVRDLSIGAFDPVTTTKRARYTGMKEIRDEKTGQVKEKVPQYREEQGDFLMATDEALANAQALERMRKQTEKAAKEAKAQVDSVLDRPEAVGDAAALRAQLKRPSDSDLQAIKDDLPEEIHDVIDEIADAIGEAPEKQGDAAALRAQMMERQQTGERPVADVTFSEPKSLSEQIADERVAAAREQQQQLAMPREVERTREEVEARIAEIDKKIEPRMRSLMQGAREMGVESTLYRNRKRGPGGGGEWVPRYKRGKEAFGEGHVRYPDQPNMGVVGAGRSFEDHFYNRLYKAIDEYLDRNPGPSPIREFSDLLDERYELQQLLDANLDPDVIFGGKPAPGYGTRQISEAEARLREAKKDRPSRQATDRTSPKRDKGLDARALGTNPRQMKAVGLSQGEAQRLTAKVAEVTTWARRQGREATEAEIKQAITESTRKGKAEVQRIYDKMQEGRGYGVAERGVQMRPGSLKKHIEQVFDDAPESWIQERADELKPLLSEEFKMAKEEGRAANADNLMRALEEVFGPDAEMMAEQLWGHTPEGGGGGVSGGQSKIDVFVREFFAAPPRERYTFTRPSDEIEQVVSKGWSMRDRKVTQQAKMESVEIPLSQNEMRKALQKWWYGMLEKAPDKGWRARIAKRKMEFEKAEIARIEEWWKAGLLSDEQVRELKKEWQRQDESTHTPVRLVGGTLDTINQLTSIALLYLRPGYIPPNLLGQALFASIDHSFNPLAIARSFKQERALAAGKFGAEELRRVDMALGEGIYMSIGSQPGISANVARMHDRLARFYGAFLDEPWRRAAWFNEAHKKGYSTPEMQRALLRATPDSPMWNDYVEVVRRAARNMVDFSRMNKFEKQMMRRVVMFYPWIKGSTVWAGRFASEHPAQFLLAMQTARQGKEETQRILGDVPSFMEGIIPTSLSENIPGLGDVPMVVNPQSFSLTGSAGDVLDVARTALFGGVQKDESLANFLTPTMNAAVSAVTRTNPFTGATYRQGESPLKIFGQEMYKAIPGARLMAEALNITPTKQEDIASGNLDPEKVLLPTGLRDDAMRYFTGISPVPYNPVRGQELAAAEVSSTLGKEKQTANRWLLKGKEYNDLSKQAGLGPMPQWARQALVTKGRRVTNYERWASKAGKSVQDMSQIEKLQADFALMVEMGLLDERSARAMLIQWANYSEDSISSYRSRLGEQYFGNPQLRAYREQLVLSGVPADQIPDTDLR